MPADGRRSPRHPARVAPKADLDHPAEPPPGDPDPGPRRPPSAGPRSVRGSLVSVGFGGSARRCGLTARRARPGLRLRGPRRRAQFGEERAWPGLLRSAGPGFLAPAVPLLQVPGDRPCRKCPPSYQPGAVHSSMCRWQPLALPLWPTLPIFCPVRTLWPSRSGDGFLRCIRLARRRQRGVGQAAPQASTMAAAKSSGDALLLT